MFIAVFSLLQGGEVRCVECSLQLHLSVAIITALDVSISYLENANGSKSEYLGSYKNGSDAAHVYSYDGNGNITSIVHGNERTTYVYDGLNQLIRVNDSASNTTTIYTYDQGGNIISKIEYNYTSGRLPSNTRNTYTYSYDSEWKDLLVSYNGEAITYDEIGNPLSYCGYDMTWNGRQLHNMYNAEKNLTFTYDENGMRVGKDAVSTVGGNKSRLDKTTYTYAVSQLVSGMRRNVNGIVAAAMQYSYDTDGTMVSVKYNGTEYYYLRNGQNDIVGIIDRSGTTVVEYRYDAWGKLLSTTGSLASTLGKDNPIRYRGYYYDTETGLYYLQSRYYDPDTGRFINADDVDFIGVTGTIPSHNLFAYCENNPVNNSDPSGCFVIRRWMIACIVDALLCLIPGLSMAVAPVKTIAKQYAGVTLKQRLKSPLTKLLQFVVKNATKLLNGVKSAISSIGRIGKWLSRIINVPKMVAKLAGLVSSATINKILNIIVPNIDIFLSIGGIVSGILDLAFDRQLNNSIWVF